jgi:hypothetical protein
MSQVCRSRFFRVAVLPVVAWLLVLATAVTYGAAPRRTPVRQPVQRQQQPAAPAVPIVIAYKTDGTSVRGQVTAVDPDGVTLTPPAKPGVGGATPESEPSPVTVAWKDIRSMSNGLTQAKAIVQWKQAHHEQLCETCHGDRTVPCPTCKGTMHDPASGKDCPTCHGELLVDCKAPKCDHGKVPCPNHCLQLTEGQWVKRDDGLKWRTFPMGHAWFSFSEHHLGHIITVDRKAGTVTDTGVCPVCNGTTKADCAVCHGLGRVPCATCSARTDVPACPAHCEQGRVKCPTCEGTGLKKA